MENSAANCPELQMFMDYLSKISPITNNDSDDENTAPDTKKINNLKMLQLICGDERDESADTIDDDPDFEKSEKEIAKSVKETERRFEDIFQTLDNLDNRYEININKDSLKTCYSKKREEKTAKIQRLSLVAYSVKSDVAKIKLKLKKESRNMLGFDFNKRPMPESGHGVYVGTEKDLYWLLGSVLKSYGKGKYPEVSRFGTVFEVAIKVCGIPKMYKTVPGYLVAYTKIPPSRHIVGTRVLAKYIQSEQGDYGRVNRHFYQSTVIELPNPVNLFRYLVIFDDGSPYYVNHSNTRLIVEKPPKQWNGICKWVRDFLNDYIQCYPNRFMNTFEVNDEVLVYTNDTWTPGKVVKIDSSLVSVKYNNDKTDWHFRGSTRIKKAESIMYARPKSLHTIGRAYTQSTDTLENEQAVGQVSIPDNLNIAKALADMYTNKLFEYVKYETKNTSDQSAERRSDVRHNRPPMDIEGPNIGNDSGGAGPTSICKTADTRTVIPRPELVRPNLGTQPLGSRFLRQPQPTNVRASMEMARRHFPTPQTSLAVRPISALTNPPLFAQKAPQVAKKSTCFVATAKERKTTMVLPKRPPYIKPACVFKPHQTEPLPHYSKISKMEFEPQKVFKARCYKPHECSPRCGDSRRVTHLNGVSPLVKPLLLGWERLCVNKVGAFNFRMGSVIYKTPCALRLTNMDEVFDYLLTVNSNLSVDCFTFNVDIKCLDEFVQQRCNTRIKDISEGKEAVPVPCVNYVDSSFPTNFKYSTKRIITKGVPLNLDPDFLSKCDCEDDCQDKEKCACWQLTISGAEKIGMKSDEVGYQYRRLLEPVMTGIYECNDRCGCRKTCLNKVVQFPLQLKLQVFKTKSRGWGLRTINDVPRGSFICIYTGKLLTGAAANKNGKKFGDEFFAELDYIECAELFKEGYEKYVREEEAWEKNEVIILSSSDEDDEEEEDDVDEEEEDDENNDDDDEDFRPDLVVLPPAYDCKKSLRNRENAIKKSGSDGGRLATARTTRELYSKRESSYVMDAKFMGNIGRFFNHSCAPNLFVQNVFVDSQDIRFPWVAFFALTNIKAGSELTWNYNYEIGGVKDKVIYCGCGAKYCKKRLL